jgi:hypothetical protein
MPKFIGSLVHWFSSAAVVENFEQRHAMFTTFPNCRITQKANHKCTFFSNTTAQDQAFQHFAAVPGIIRVFL